MALKGSKQRYLPPLTGKLEICVSDGFTRKKIIRVMSSCDREYLNDVAAGAGVDSVAMISNGLQSSMLRLGL